MADPRQIVTIIMKSGAELVFDCSDATINKANGKVVSVTLTGLKGQNFLYICLDEIAAVLYREK